MSTGTRPSTSRSSSPPLPEDLASAHPAPGRGRRIAIECALVLGGFALVAIAHTWPMILELDSHSALAHRPAVRRLDDRLGAARAPPPERAVRRQHLRPRAGHARVLARAARHRRAAAPGALGRALARRRVERRTARRVHALGRVGVRVRPDRDRLTRRRRDRGARLLVRAGGHGPGRAPLHGHAAGPAARRGRGLVAGRPGEAERLVVGAGGRAGGDAGVAGVELLLPDRLHRRRRARRGRGAVPVVRAARLRVPRRGRRRGRCRDRAHGDPVPARARPVPRDRVAARRDLGVRRALHRGRLPRSAVGSVARRADRLGGGKGVPRPGRARLRGVRGHRGATVGTAAAAGVVGRHRAHRHRVPDGDRRLGLGLAAVRALPPGVRGRSRVHGAARHRTGVDHRHARPRPPRRHRRGVAAGPARAGIVAGAGPRRARSRCSCHWWRCSWWRRG